MEFENEMHGGAIPIGPLYGKSRFELVCNMIQSATKIECISYSSLKGFVFSIEGIPHFKSVTPQLSTSQSSEKRILELGKIILKFTLLRKDNTDKKLPEFKMDFKEVEDDDKKKEISKETDLEKDFKNESFTQLDIFTRSFQIGALSICPSILTRTVLENNEANIFLDFIESKLNVSAGIEKEVITYMKAEVNTYSLGIIAMEYAEKFVLLNDFYKSYFKVDDISEKNNKIIKSLASYPEKIYPEKIFLNDVENIILYHRIALVLSNMLLLLFEFFYLHYDLHLNNVFVLNYKESPSCDNFLDLLNPQAGNTLMSCSRMIDFGRVYKIETTTTTTTTKQKESKWFVSNEEVEIIEEKEKQLFSNYDKFIELITKDSFDFNNKDNFGEASTFIEGFLTFMFNKDAELNKNGRPQCFGIFYLGGLAEKTKEGYKLRLDESKNKDYIFFLIIKYFRTIYKKSRTSESRNGKKKPPRFQYFKDTKANNFQKIFNERDEDKKLKKEGYTEHSLPGIFLNIGLDMLEKKGVTSEKIKIENTKLTISQPTVDKPFLENMNNVIKKLGGTIEFTILNNF
jgi:hypothetical protein